MGKLNFKEVDGVDVKGAFSGSTIGSSIKEKVEESSREHAYIVFKKSTGIDEGIAAIESKVLNGEKLDVTRKDETGNAIVAIVSSTQRKQIEKMSEVEKVKVNEKAELTGKVKEEKEKIQKKTEEVDQKLKKEKDKVNSEKEKLKEKTIEKTEKEKEKVKEDISEKNTGKVVQGTIENSSSSTTGKSEQNTDKTAQKAVKNSSEGTTAKSNNKTEKVAQGTIENSSESITETSGQNNIQKEESQVLKNNSGDGTSVLEGFQESTSSTVDDGNVKAQNSLSFIGTSVVIAILAIISAIIGFTAFFKRKHKK